MGDIVSEAEFEGISFEQLEGLSDSELDELSFGVVGLSRDGLVDRYNATEQRIAGLPASKAVGIHFFNSVAPCMNNFMVAQRYEDEAEIDAVVDYVLTLRMRPTPVRLRLIQRLQAARSYLLVERSGSFK